MIISELFDLLLGLLDGWNFNGYYIYKPVSLYDSFGSDLTEDKLSVINRIHAIVIIDNIVKYGVSGDTGCLASVDLNDPAFNFLEFVSVCNFNTRLVV